LIGAILYPVSLSTHLFGSDAGFDFWQTLSDRMRQEWTHGPGQQLYLALLLYVLVALPQVFVETVCKHDVIIQILVNDIDCLGVGLQELFFRGALQQLLHTWLDSRLDRAVFYTKDAIASSSKPSSSSSSSVDLDEKAQVREMLTKTTASAQFQDYLSGYIDSVHSIASSSMNTSTSTVFSPLSSSNLSSTSSSSSSSDFLPPPSPYQYMRDDNSAAASPRVHSINHNRSASISVSSISSQRQHPHFPSVSLHTYTSSNQDIESDIAPMRSTSTTGSKLLSTTMLNPDQAFYNRAVVTLPGPLQELQQKRANNIRQRKAAALEKNRAQISYLQHDDERNRRASSDDNDAMSYSASKKALSKPLLLNDKEEAVSERPDIRANSQVSGHSRSASPSHSSPRHTFSPSSSSSHLDATFGAPVLSSAASSQPADASTSSSSSSSSSSPSSSTLFTALDAQTESMLVETHVRSVGLKFRRLMRDAPPNWQDMCVSN
jgi:hypothetical protein